MIRSNAALAALLASALLSACSQETSLSVGSGGDVAAWSGGENIAQGSDGSVDDSEVVALLEVVAPESEEFLLQATVPVPRGTLTEAALSVPLSVRDENGVACPTQVVPVTRYARWSDGADVVEVLAHVRRPEGVEPGTRIEFELGHNPHARKDLITGEAIAGLLGSPGALELQAHDAYGNAYSADLLAGWTRTDDTPDAIRASTEVLRDGQVARTVRTHRVLTPDQPQGGSQATLPHLFGVHAYTTAWRGRDILSLDLHVHNGMDGLDAGTTLDDALGEVYFQDLTLRTPPGYQVAALIEGPTHGPSFNSDGWRYHQLIEARGDGQLHWIPQQGRLIRRLVVFHPDEQQAALELLRSHWRGFVSPGTTPDGREAWSWWNPLTSRFLAQNARLPELDHLSMEGLRAGFDSKWSQLITQTRTGNEGGYPFTSPALGWAHPWGVAYGGMAGGDEIWPLDGIIAAWTRSQAAYRVAQLQARCYVDRQPQALYDVAGRPTQVEDLLVEGAQGPFVKCWFFERPNPESDPFGFGEAPQWQANYAESAGLVPDYREELSGWMHIDHQHLIRYTRNLKTLLWLGGDLLARDLLHASAETVRLSWHQYPLTPYYQTQNTQMYARLQYVASAPGVGFDFRRSESWGLDAALCAYAAGTEEVRDTLRPWMDLAMDLIEDGQSTCTGNVMSARFYEFFYQQYRLRQTFEESFLSNTLRSLATTLFEGVDEERHEAALRVQLASANATITPPFWDEQAGKPFFRIGVGPWDGQEGEFCTNIPEDAYLPWHDGTNALPMMAWAHQQTGGELFLGKASSMLGGGDLRTLLEERGTTDLGTWAPLLALTQRPLED